MRLNHCQLPGWCQIFHALQLCSLFNQDIKFVCKFHRCNIMSHRTQIFAGSAFQRQITFIFSASNVNFRYTGIKFRCEHSTYYFHIPGIFKTYFIPSVFAVLHDSILSIHIIAKFIIMFCALFLNGI